MIILAVRDSSLFEVENFNKWNEFSHKLDSFPEVDFSISIGDIKKLKKDKKNQKFFLESLYDKDPETEDEVQQIRTELFDNLPFYDNILFNKNTGTIQTAIYIDKAIVNSKDP